MRARAGEVLVQDSLEFIQHQRLCQKKGPAHIITRFDVVLPSQLLRDIEMPALDVHLIVDIGLGRRHENLAGVFRVQIFGDDAPGGVMRLIGGGDRWDLAGRTRDEDVSLDGGRQYAE